MATNHPTGGRATGRGMPFHRSFMIAGLMAAQLCGGTGAARASEPGVSTASQPAATTAITLGAPAPDPAARLVRVQLHTAHGDIVLALDPVHAPVTAANFLHYVDQKRFDGALFYRAVKIGDDGKYGLVQGGLYGTHLQPFKPIAHEAPFVTGLHHAEGAVSMARQDPGTAQSEFFIDIGDLPEYDGNKVDEPGYAVFGYVESGMDVVKKMLMMPRAPDKGDGFDGQLLAAPVKIISARRADTPRAKP